MSRKTTFQLGLAVIMAVSLFMIAAAPNAQERIRDLIATKIRVLAGGITMVGGDIDLNGNQLVVDSDGDTTIDASTVDDQIDIAVAGSDVISITSNGLINSGFTIVQESSVVVMTDTGTLTLSSGYQPITSTAEVTASATTAIADGAVVGQTACIVNENASAVIHFPDSANTNLSSQADLGNDDVLCLLWDGADWLEISQIDN